MSKCFKTEKYRGSQNYRTPFVIDFSLWKRIAGSNVNSDFDSSRSSLSSAVYWKLSKMTSLCDFLKMRKTPFLTFKKKFVRHRFKCSHLIELKILSKMSGRTALHDFPLRSYKYNKSRKIRKIIKNWLKTGFFRLLLYL